MSAQAIKTRPIGENVTPKQKKILTAFTEHPQASCRALAKYTNSSVSTVHEILQRYGISKSYVSEFKENRADIFAGLQSRLLSSISEQDIQKTPVGSRVLAAAQLYDKERLERGLSNAEQPIMIIVKNSVQVEGASTNAPEDSKLVDITPGDKALHHITP